jgi:hypothetical protein
MTPQIDVIEVLRGTVCDLYSNLLTRPTGAAVRVAIEALLAAPAHAETERPAGVAVLDFTHVRLLDFSCADEIVGKLLLRTAGRDATMPSYLLFRGLHEDHIDPIETVLDRYALALVAQMPDGIMLFGTVDAEERAAWNVVRRLGRAHATVVAAQLPTDPRQADLVLSRLVERRLLMRIDEEFTVVDIPLAA